MEAKQHNDLTAEERRVIEFKGTEPPFSGEYEGFFEPGVYVCRRCSAPLYRSNDKFDAHCGWPALTTRSRARCDASPIRTATASKLSASTAGDTLDTYSWEKA